MKRNRRNKVIFMIIAIVIILITLKMALSVPLTLDYQGILRNSTTNTLMTGNYVFNFSLYNVSNNILLYNEYSTIYVNSGVWNHHIGLTNPLLAGYFSANTYVITAINGQNLTRVNITSVPYSLYSLESNNTQYLNGQASSYYYQSTNPMGFINSTQANSTYTLINSTLNASYILNPPWLTSYVDTNDTVALIALQSKQSADNSSLKSEIDLKYDKTGGNINGNVIINGNLTIFGSVINLTVNNIFANGSYIPDYNALFDIGSSALKYNNGYFVTLYGNLNASYIQNAPWITSYTDTNDTVALIAETNARIGNDSLKYDASNPKQYINTSGETDQVFVANRTSIWDAINSKISDGNTNWDNTYDFITSMFGNATYKTITASNADNSTQSGLINAKALPGTASCAAGTVPQNITTTTTGITSQCVALLSIVDTNDTVALIALQDRQSADNTSLKTQIDTKYNSSNPAGYISSYTDTNDTIALTSQIARQSADNTSLKTQIDLKANISDVASITTIQNVNTTLNTSKLNIATYNTGIALKVSWSDLVASIGNWSLDKSSYALLTTVQDVNSTLGTNISTLTSRQSTDNTSLKTQIDTKAKSGTCSGGGQYMSSINDTAVVCSTPSGSGNTTEQMQNAVLPAIIGASGISYVYSDADNTSSITLVYNDTVFMLNTADEFDIRESFWNSYTLLTTAQNINSTLKSQIDLKANISQLSSYTLTATTADVNNTLKSQIDTKVNITQYQTALNLKANQSTVSSNNNTLKTQIDLKANISDVASILTIQNVNTTLNISKLNIADASTIYKTITASDADNSTQAILINAGFTNDSTIFSREFADNTSLKLQIDNKANISQLSSYTLTTTTTDVNTTLKSQIDTKVNITQYQTALDLKANQSTVSSNNITLKSQIDLKANITDVASITTIQNVNTTLNTSKLNVADATAIYKTITASNADNSTQATLITAGFTNDSTIFSRQSADNTSLKTQIDLKANISDVASITTIQNVNTSLTTNISVLSSRQSADNSTQSGLINLKALPGACTGTSVVQNTTTTGVQCITPVGGVDTNDTTALIAQINRQSADNSTQSGLINAKALPGTCPTGSIMQNSTITGVQCVIDQTGTSTEDGTGGWINTSGDTSTYMRILARSNITDSENYTSNYFYSSAQLNNASISAYNFYINTNDYKDNTSLRGLYGIDSVLQVSDGTQKNITINSIYGIFSAPYINAGSNITVTNVFGIYSLQQFAGLTAAKDNIVSNAYGIYSGYSGIGSTAVKNFYGIYLTTPATTAGSLQNNTALYIASQAKGSVNDYAIYTNAGKVRFGDNLTFAAGQGINASYIQNAPWITSYTDTNDTTALIALQNRQSADNTSLKSQINLKVNITQYQTALNLKANQSSLLWINNTAVDANATAVAALPKAGGTVTGNVIFNDNIKLIFGTDSDVYIMYNSTAGYGELG